MPKPFKCKIVTYSLWNFFSIKTMTLKCVVLKLKEFENNNFIKFSIRLDVHVEATNEKTSILLQTLGLVCSQTKFIIYSWKKMQQYRKGDALLLPRFFAFPSSSSDQKDLSKVMKRKLDLNLKPSNNSFPYK